MIDAEWVPLAKLARSTSQAAAEGVQVNLFTSPYDIPEAVRGDYDRQLGRFVIEFRYIGEEPVRLIQQEDCLWLRVGKHSNRLYAIEIDVDALKAGSVSLHVLVPDRVAQAIDRSAPHQGHRRMNYELAKNAIEQKKHEVFESLAQV